MIDPREQPLDQVVESSEAPMRNAEISEVFMKLKYVLNENQRGLLVLFRVLV